MTYFDHRQSPRVNDHLRKGNMSKQHPGKNAILRLTLPIPPSINEQYATVNGHRVSTPVAKRFKQHVRSVIQAMDRSGQLTEDLRAQFARGYLSLLLIFYFETPLKRDLDGGLKITQDAICD